MHRHTQLFENPGITWLRGVDGKVERHLRFRPYAIADSVVFSTLCAAFGDTRAEQNRSQGRSAQLNDTMSEQTAIEQATRRLTAALDALDAAVERRVETDRGAAALGEQVHALAADRSRLAADLDTQVARAKHLEAANRDIARRIDAAMENIRLVLESND